MELIYEFCKNNGYSSSLTNYIIELFLTFSAKASKKDSQNFVNVLFSTKIVLVNSLESFVRIIVARVNKENEIFSDEDKKILSHEIFHLLRSYSDNEFEYFNETLHLKSGVITILKTFQNGKIDYPNSIKENVQIEENFVDFLGRKYDALIQIDSIDNVFESLKEKIGNS